MTNVECTHIRNPSVLLHKHLPWNVITRATNKESMQGDTLKL